MAQVSVVLFDMDGVLIDSYQVWFQLLRQTPQHFGFPPVSAEDFARTWGQGVEADIDAFMPGTPIDAVQAFYSEHYADHLEHVQTEPGALETLQALRGMRDRIAGVGCVTNTPGALARKILGIRGILPLLDLVVGADEAGRSKPAPDGIFKACRHFGYHPSQAVMVGDSSYDRDAAAAAGCAFVGVKMPTRYRVDHLGALLPLLGL